MKDQLNVAHLRVLLAVVRTGSFSGAAVELKLSQPGVSHAIQALEQSVGTRLIERRAAGALLTPAGLKVLPIARHIVEEVERFRAEAKAQVSPSGVVRIASFPSLVQHVMPEVLAQARTQFPGIEVQLSDAHLERHGVEGAVLHGEADVGLTQLPAHPKLLTRAIADDPYLLLLPADWEPVSVWARPYIHLGLLSDDFVLRHLQRQGRHLRPSLTLMTEGAILALVNRGLGFTLLPRLTLGALPPDVRVCPLPTPVVRTLGTITRPGQLSPASRCLLKLIWEQHLLDVLPALS